MKGFRTILFWIHLAVGAAAGIVIFIMSVTGVALTYEKQVIEWADRAAWAAPADAGPQLPPETLIAAAAAARPEKPVVGLTMRADAAAPATITFEGNSALLVDPYTAAIIGEPPTAWRSFFRTMTVWHRYLALEGASRTTGKAVTGAANLGFLFLVVSGLYLWFPRVWTWIQFRNVLWFRAGLSSKARDFNWHNAIGFWACAPLAIVVAGAVPISYGWGNTLVYRMMGDPLPAAAPARPATRGEQPPQTYVVDGLNASWHAVIDEVPSWRTMTTRLATNAKAPIVVTVDEGYGGQPQLRRTISIDRASAAVLKNEGFQNLSPGRRVRSWLRFAHTGEFYGLAGQTIAGLASLGGVFLVYTGIALALRRLVAWIKRRNSASMTLERPRAA